MAVSENGWTVIESGSDPRLQAFPWVTGKVLAGDVFTVLEYVARRFHTEVEGIDLDSSWGYSHRYIGDTTTWSNHASGTAIDLNATLHPLGVVGTFTSTQRAGIDQILAATSPVIRWGGGDQYDTKDEMHFEINEGISAAEVATVAAGLGGGTNPTNPTSPEEDDMRIALITTTGTSAWAATDGLRKRILAPGEPQILADLGLIDQSQVATAKWIPNARFDALPTVG
jgi:hypothetical protein